MGTFHQHRGELHGITVVVETGAELWVGRCDTADDRGVFLLDADVHVKPEMTASVTFQEAHADKGRTGGSDPAAGAPSAPIVLVPKRALADQTGRPPNPFDNE